MVSEKFIVQVGNVFLLAALVKLAIWESRVKFPETQILCHPAPSIF